LSNWTGVGTAVTDATYRLTSLTNVNSFLGFTTGEDTARDTLLTNCIDRATDAIEKYCDRKFVSRNFRLERYDGDGDNWLFLKNRPVRSISQISIGSKTALSVKCTTTDAVNAHIDIDSDGVHVTEITKTGGSTSDLLFTNYATISAMVVQIDSYTGWTASVLGSNGNQRASDLLDIYGEYCLDQTLNIQMPDTPIYDFTLWKEGGREMGILYRSGGWTSGIMNVIVTYTAGYASGSLPNDIEQACLQLVSTIYHQSKRDMSLESEKLGDYSYKVATDPFVNSRAANIIPGSYIANILDSYRLIPVVG